MKSKIGSRLPDRRDPDGLGQPLRKSVREKFQRRVLNRVQQHLLGPRRGTKAKVGRSSSTVSFGNEKYYVMDNLRAIPIEDYRESAGITKKGEKGGKVPRPLQC